MKKGILILLLGIAIGSIFTSCTKDDDNDVNIDDTEKRKYILNYGSYSGAKSTITLFDTEKDTMVNNYYEVVNEVAPVSNYQYAYNYDGKVFFMGNNVDNITYVDAQTFEQTNNGISTDIIKPRYCVASENTLYVSCWGGDIWTDITLSYIAKIDLTTMTVSSKIALAGGPEGLEIANGKLYAALNYVDSVAVINLSDDAISYIATPAVSSYFIKDINDNLYVSLLSTYSVPSETTGLGYINTTSDVLEDVFALNGISTSYGSQMAVNNDFSKIYVVASGYNDNWELVGSVATFNTTSQAFETELFVDGIVGINGVAVDTETDNVMVLISESVTAYGKIKAYKADGTFHKEYTTGIAPTMLLTVE